jgi:formylglycine-generating enzyme required for sulfatase activity
MDEHEYWGCGTHSTMAVGSKSPAGDSPFGAHDMAGNVSEWVEDCYQDSYADAPVDGTARKTCTTYGGSYRVIRGGGFVSGAHDLRASDRNGSGSLGDAYYYYAFGSRCCRSPEE